MPDSVRADGARRSAPRTIGRHTNRAIAFSINPFECRWRSQKIGGIEGKIGKQPPDIHVWVLGGEAPAFVKMEGPLFYGGPIWRIELASPVWPKQR